MEPIRSALYLDFDNVFGGLLTLDPKLAQRFAREPQLWLDRLASGSEDESSRRWLVLRCYMNPAGWVTNPENETTRLYFSKFRPFFTDAGFEVVDCPRLSHTKNGADIRLVIDAVEALRADVRYDEFVIASGDSDMTPLLVRLRASDRRTTIISPSDSAVVLGAVADRLIGGEDTLELLTSATRTADTEEPGGDGEADRAVVHPLPATPDESQVSGGSAAPEAVARVVRDLRMPSLPTETWLGIFDALAAFVAAHEFNLTEATRWARDRLVDNGVRVSRQAVSFVAHGVAYGGCPLYRQPPPLADELAKAFVFNVLNRAKAADVELSPEELQEIRTWLGAPQDDQPTGS